jgi:transcription-repair coupling factor (superfamily II helicase)
MRLTLYKRLADCKTQSDLDEMQVEMIDRFGLLPEPVKSLFQITELKQTGEKLGLKKIEVGPNGGRLQFTPATMVEPLTIIKMVQSQPDRFRLQNNDQLSFTMALDDPAARFQAVSEVLVQLAPIG